MDEWDEFLSRADNDPQDEPMKRVESETEPIPVVGTSDLGEFGDNAEVLIQMARGESFNSLSSNGVWINSSQTTNTQSNTSGFVGKKRTLKTTTTGPSVPIANSIQDLTRAITGHPLLSHPLSLLNQSNPTDTNTSREIDSLGLFFYGTPGEVKIEWNGKDDMMKIIEMKKRLIDRSIFTNNICENRGIQSPQFVDLMISYENLNLLAGAIPPNGKTSWIIPFTVKSKTTNLTQKAVYKSDPLTCFYEFCHKSVHNQMGNLSEFSEHFITIEDSLKVCVLTSSPPFNISVNFRGENHVDPVSLCTNFLFYRQSNYSVEIDFESLKIKSIKSFLPKFDNQNRLLLLLKALNNKFTKLEDGNYLLVHPSNTPFIKILSTNDSLV